MTTGSSSVLLLDGDQHHTLTGQVTAGRILAPAEAIAETCGWAVKPEGLCRDDVCIPVRDRAGLVTGGLIDLGRLGELLGREVVVDAPAAAVALGDPADEVAERMRGLAAPAFTLPDLDGRPVSLADFDRRKRLLLAWSSW